MKSSISFGLVFATPFERAAVTPVKSGNHELAVVRNTNRHTLAWLEVLHPCEGTSPHTMSLAKHIRPGTKIGVSANDYVQTWAKTEYEIDGRKCIMVPFEAIRMVTNDDQQP